MRLKRVILSQHGPRPLLPSGPDGVEIFRSLDDPSVGPWTGWPDVDAVARTRAEWRLSISRDPVMDDWTAEYLLDPWACVHPRFPTETLIADPDMRIPDAATALSEADAVEVWRHDSPHGLVWLWHVVAWIGARGGLTPTLSALALPESEAATDALWHSGLAGDADHAARLERLDRQAQDRMRRLWEAAIALPAPPDPDLLAEPGAQQAFDILAGRRPDPRTGLSTLRLRLLAATRPDWTRMALVIGQTMARSLEDGDWVGDVWLQSELEEMARLDPPLVEIEGTGAMRDCKVRRTASGTATMPT